MPIPALEPSGILPPYIGDATQSSNMSPYATTLVEVAQRFCTTDPRKAIFRGLLEHRQRLNAIGFTNGTQWLSVSFLEDIETIDSRAPRDVDVVTFFHCPATIPTVAALQALLTANLGRHLALANQGPGTFYPVQCTPEWRRGSPVGPRQKCL